MPRRARAETVAPDDRFPAMSLRRRVLIAVLAVATATTLIMMMLERTGAPEIPRPPAAAGPAPCTEGQLSGCLGGKADVIPVSAGAAASAALAVPAGAGK